MRPLRGVVVSSAKNKAIVLCENGTKLTTIIQTKDLEFGVEVEIYFELDTMKITKIRRLDMDNEIMKSEGLLPINEESAISADLLTEEEYYHEE